MWRVMAANIAVWQQHRATSLGAAASRGGSINENGGSISEKRSGVAASAAETHQCIDAIVI